MDFQKKKGKEKKKKKRNFFYTLNEIFGKKPIKFK